MWHCKMHVRRLFTPWLLCGADVGAALEFTNQLGGAMLVLEYKREARITADVWPQYLPLNSPSGWQAGGSIGTFSLADSTNYHHVRLGCCAYLPAPLTHLALFRSAQFSSAYR